MFDPVRCPKCNTAITGILDVPAVELPPCPVHYTFSLGAPLHRVAPCGHEFSADWVATALSESDRRAAGYPPLRMPSPYREKIVEAAETFLTTLYRRELDRDGDAAAIKAWQEQAVRIIFAHAPDGTIAINIGDCAAWEIEAGGPAYVQQLREMTKARFVPESDASMTVYRFSQLPPRPSYAAYRQKIVDGIVLALGEADPAMLLRIARWTVRGRRITGTLPDALAKLCVEAVQLIAEADWDFPLRARLDERRKSGLVARCGQTGAHTFANCTPDDRDFLIVFLEFVLTQKVSTAQPARSWLGRRKRRTIRQEKICVDIVAANETHRL